VAAVAERLPGSVSSLLYPINTRRGTLISSSIILKYIVDESSGHAVRRVGAQNAMRKRRTAAKAKARRANAKRGGEDGAGKHLRVAMA